MTIRPGRNLTRAAFALPFVAALALALPLCAWLAAGAVVALLVLAAADLIAVRRVARTLQVSRSVPARVARGSIFNVVLTLDVNSPAGFVAEVRDGLPHDADRDAWSSEAPLPAGRATSLTYSCSLPVRGLHEFGPVWVRLHSARNLIEVQKEIGTFSKVKSLPESLVAGDALDKDTQSRQELLEEQSRQRLRGEGTEFESLAEFRQGDDPRRIDWRTTARSGRLTVRRYQIEQHRDVVVIVDSGRLMGSDAGHGTKLDRAVDAALMMGRASLDHGDRCGLGVFDDRVRTYLPPMSGRQAMRVLTEHLYDVRSNWGEPAFAQMFAALHARQLKRALVVILSDMADEETSRDFRVSLASLAQRHVVVLAAIRTPALGQVVSSPVESERDVTRKAVVFRLLRQRERALHAVERSGVHVLDLEPTQITVPLLNKYIDLRQRNLV